MNGGLLVITEGRDGAHLLSPQGKVHKLAYPVQHLVDTVGAGDSFHAAFLGKLLNSDSLNEDIDSIDLSALVRALDYACAAAAINVSRTGCSPPTAEEVNQLVKA